MTQLAAKLIGLIKTLLVRNPKIGTMITKRSYEIFGRALTLGELYNILEEHADEYSEQIIKLFDTLTDADAQTDSTVIIQQQNAKTQPSVKEKSRTKLADDQVWGQIATTDNSNKLAKVPSAQKPGTLKAPNAPQAALEKQATQVNQLRVDTSWYWLIISRYGTLQNFLHLRRETRPDVTLLQLEKQILGQL